MQEQDDVTVPLHFFPSDMVISKSLVVCVNLITPSYSITFKLNGSKLCLLCSWVIIQIKYLVHLGLPFKISIGILLPAERGNGHFNFTETIFILAVLMITAMSIMVSTMFTKLVVTIISKVAKIGTTMSIITTMVTMGASSLFITIIRLIINIKISNTSNRNAPRVTKKLRPPINATKITKASIKPSATTMAAATTTTTTATTCSSMVCA
jgi:hypothetical protein